MTIISRVKAMSKKELAITVALTAVTGAVVYLGVRALLDGKSATAATVIVTVETDATDAVDGVVTEAPTPTTDPTPEV